MSDEQMMGLEHAQEAMHAFFAYAKMIEEKTPYLPTLRLYYDGSGRVCDDVANVVFFSIGSLDNLRDECVKRTEKRNIRHKRTSR